MSMAGNSPGLKGLMHSALGAMAIAGVVAFWIGICMAARHYPSEYDWRYITISSLVYPDRNPTGHVWASAGIFLCGLGGLCWVTAVASRYGPDAAGQRPPGIWALALGFACMACTALLTERPLLVPDLHEILAVSAFLGICTGLVRQTLHAVARNSRLRPGVPTRGMRMFAGVLAAAALAPVVLAGLAQAYVGYARPELPWVNISWRALGVPAYLSFAFWEWVTCGVLSGYVAALTVAMNIQHDDGLAAKPG
jgi:hypothetical protein